MKTNEFKRKISEYHTEMGTQEDDKDIYVCFTITSGIETTYYCIATVSIRNVNDYKINLHSNLPVSFDVDKSFVDLINEYASTPIEERENDEDKIKSMQETIDKLTIDRDYFQHQFIASQPTIQPLSHINDRLPFSERIESNLHDLNVAINDLKYDLDIIKNKKPRWFD